ncbi:RNA polymerase sigma factor [Polaribacter aestuariivivens]|uniref:RNA polymerase sigma factor n=1 Tax=Polaribacter aestuariivivens TaxID=2304626 RepID=A0A5S3NAN9_9FLAO|nr:RNA polymerase sigma factor [Polaribacter aestuariivivens]TMM32361.1 RNA polymerase sigma factor [Polaribacter aestuariivivens]
MKHLTDEEIMLQIADGQLQLLSILFDRYHVRIYNYFNKMVHNKMVSEDLTQDVFLKIIKYKTSYKNGNFAAWIYTIARNIFSSYYQRVKKERSNEINDDLLASEETTVSESKQEELDHLQKALLKLKRSERELIVMHRFQEIKYEQIAQIIGSSENAVKVKTHRALKKLKEIYFQA